MRPRTISYQEGTVVVISIVPMPPSIAARQAWNAASGLSVRMTPQSPVGNTTSMLFTPKPLSVRTDSPHRVHSRRYASTYV